MNRNLGTSSQFTPCPAMERSRELRVHRSNPDRHKLIRHLTQNWRNRRWTISCSSRYSIGPRMYPWTWFVTLKYPKEKSPKHRNFRAVNAEDAFDCWTSEMLDRDGTRSSTRISALSNGATTVTHFFTFCFSGALVTKYLEIGSGAGSRFPGEVHGNVHSITRLLASFGTSSSRNIATSSTRLLASAHTFVRLITCGNKTL